MVRWHFVCKAFVKFTLICLALVIILQVNRYYQRVMNSFALFKIVHVLPIEEEFAPPRLSIAEIQSVRSILAQPFTAFAKGSQSFVFLSEDGKYILKFNKFYSKFDSSWLQSLPLLGWFDRGLQDPIDNESEVLKRSFRSYLVAYQYFRDETGMIYHHLQKSSSLHQKLLLIDKQGHRFNLEADDYAFIIQKRGESTYQMLGRLMENKEPEKASYYLEEILRFSSKRLQKGIEDWDFKIKHNLGFIDGVAAQIDLGSLILNKEGLSLEQAQEELKKGADELRAWLVVKYPALVPAWDASLEKVLLNLSSL
ncbi:MAG: hypothetical protein WCG10_06530 [Chlamydiota bacterium]